MKKLLSVDDLSDADLFRVFELATDFKRSGIPRRRKGNWVLVFLEPSTRTRLSFERALRALGFETYLFTAEASSLKKGESLTDTFLTLRAQGFEGVVVRTPKNGLAAELEGVDLRAINAGDGTNEHPTQALVDAFTLREVFGKLEGLRVVFVGDAKYSRVFRSGVKLFKRLGMKVGVCGPRSLKPADLSLLGVDADFTSVDEALEWCDAAVFLRIQKERQSVPLITSERDYLKLFGLTPERAQYLRRSGKFYMHPGPVNRGVEVAPSEVYGKNSLILRQVENGPFVRAAAVELLYGE
ncbi:MAG: aspartate carbamoyltransferase catalytic subunit [Aquificae bacterium]|nr:aspartate carbamoyltransferase catalytic subunit [Aquificota bacterium]